MTLDEAIIHCEEAADRCDVTDGNIKCANEHRQLAEWLKDYKRLLKENEKNTGKDIAIAFQFGMTLGFAKKCDECDDCISRQEVVDYLCAHCPDDAECHKDCDDIKNIKSFPSVTPQPEVGYWIYADGDNAICGCCNRLNHLYGTYCKHCGAKMHEL